MQVARFFFIKDLKKIIILWRWRELKHGRGKIFGLAMRKRDSAKSPGVSYTRSHRVKRKPQEHSRKNRKRASRSDDRGLRYFEPRIARSGISLFMCIACLLVPIRSSRFMVLANSLFLFSSPRQPGNFCTSQLPPWFIRSRNLLKHRWLCK